MRPPDLAGDRLDAVAARDRIARIAHDVCRYAPVMGAAFEDARALGPAPASGVAGLHHDEQA